MNEMTDELYLAGLSKGHTEHERRVDSGSGSGSLLDVRALDDHQGTTMTSTAPLTSADLTPMSVAYVESDIPDGQTLVEWRRELETTRRRIDAAQRAERRQRRRGFGLPRLPLLRPAW